MYKRQVNPYLPVLNGRMNNRDHRKLMIIDGKAAFTGGVNLADEYINLTHPHGHWKDCAVLVRGEAVWSMTAMFLAFWGYVDRSAEDLSVFRQMCIRASPIHAMRSGNTFVPQTYPLPLPIQFVIMCRE